MTFHQPQLCVSWMMLACYDGHDHDKHDTCSASPCKLFSLCGPNRNLHYSQTVFGVHQLHIVQESVWYVGRNTLWETLWHCSRIIHRYWRHLGEDQHLERLYIVPASIPSGHWLDNEDHNSTEQIWDPVETHHMARWSRFCWWPYCAVSQLLADAGEDKSIGRQLITSRSQHT